MPRPLVEPARRVLRLTSRRLLFTTAAALLLAATSVACTTSPQPTASTTGSPDTTAPAPSTMPTPAPVVPLRGDRALVNSRPRDTPFEDLDPWLDGVGYIRAWGGSRGMVTFPTEAVVPQVLRQTKGRDAYDVVSDDEIAGLLSLQRAHRTELVYLVNVNDTLASQSAFVQRLDQAGLHIAMLEMGNELYLDKFARGDTTKLGVTRQWTPDQYVDLLEAWTPRLRRVLPGVPVYGVGASHGSTDSTRDQDRKAWNEVLKRAVADEPTLIDGITFHHYAGEGRAAPTGEEETQGQDFSYLQMFGDLPIAITESGYAFSDPTEANLQSALEFWTALRAALPPNDVFGVHVLYDAEGRPGVTGFGLYDETGRTAVGDQFGAWLRTWAKPTN